MANKYIFSVDEPYVVRSMTLWYTNSVIDRFKCMTTIFSVKHQIAYPIFVPYLCSLSPLPIYVPYLRYLSLFPIFAVPYLCSLSL